MHNNNLLQTPINLDHLAVPNNLPTHKIQSKPSYIQDHNSSPYSLVNLDDIKATAVASTNILDPPELGTKLSLSPNNISSEGNNLNLVQSQRKQELGDVYAKWRKLTLVAQSIQKFRSLKAERVKSEGNLRKIIKDTQISRKSLQDAEGIMYVTTAHKHSEALESFRSQQTFFEALEAATDQDLALIRRMIVKDPKANLYDTESPYRLVNKPNHRGYTPLYVACKNGNLELVKLLLEYQANPYQLCEVSSNQNESILQVAARWGHLNLVKYLTDKNFNWPEKELKRAYNDALGGHIKKNIKTAIDKKAGSKSVLGRLFGCSQNKNTYRT